MKQNKPISSNELVWDFTIPESLVRLPIRLPKYSPTTYLLILIIAGFLINQVILMRINTGTTSFSAKPALTVFDQSMIEKLKNEGKPYPVLGTAHNHADFKVVVNGQPLNFAKPEYYMKSRLLHVDNNQSPDDSGSVLHMHAMGVPLSWFFESLNIRLTKESLTLADGKVYKNESGARLKFYINGKSVDKLDDYVIKPLDKLLISYGPEDDLGIQNQINSVTSFAKEHEEKN